MSVETLYWHDYETFGADPRRDRPVQFAGQRTDLDLNPLGDPLVCFARPSGDYLPSPSACLVTGITPQRALEEGRPEAQFITAVLAELGRPGTCGVGYNSIRFDDEVTRHTLYRNLHDPYAREWTNGNSRWDIIDMVRLTYALRPEGLEWPMKERGVPSFRLEALTAANGIAHEGAHDALADVRATIELARRVREAQPRLYEWVFSNRTKRAAGRLLDLLHPEPVLHVSARFPARHGCLAVVAPVMVHPVNRNSVVVWDLRHDPAMLEGLDADAIRRRLYTPTDRLEEGETRIPLKEVHLNRAPVLAPLKTLPPHRAEALEIDLEAAGRHFRTLEGMLERLRPLLQPVFAEREFEVEKDPDLMLYSGGFFSDADRARMEEIRRTPPEELGRRSWRFDDPRLPEMVFRYRARNWPELLDPTDRERWLAFCRERVVEGRGGWRNLEAFRAELERLSLEAPEDEHRQRLLQALARWGAEMAACLGVDFP